MDIDLLIKQKFRIHNADVPPYGGRNPNSSRKDLYDLFAEIGFTYGAEIGVERGRNTKMMFDRIPKLKLICVDPYHYYNNYYSRDACKQFEKEATQRLKGKNIIWKKVPSLTAVETIKDKSLDFVYIDGAHDFDNVMMDIIKWVPKVKKKGIVAGHDYVASRTDGVVKAVDAYIETNGIKNFYLTRNLKELCTWWWVQGG